MRLPHRPCPAPKEVRIAMARPLGHRAHERVIECVETAGENRRQYAPARVTVPARWRRSRRSTAGSAKAPPDASEASPFARASSRNHSNLEAKHR
jgi:hypothetical protein